MNKLLYLAAATSAFVAAALAATKCTTASAPCSREGYCNSGPSFCMWGLCNVQNSYNSTSCWNAEGCSSQTVTFDSSADAIAINSYTGNPNTNPYVSIFEPNNAVVENGNLVLQMTYDASQKKGFGATVDSSHTIQYGTVTARIKTASIAKGVVSAFIIRNDQLGDEIDFEWVGKEPTQVETNFFYHDELVYTNSVYYPVGGDSSADYHDYTIVWDPDYVTWMIDNKAIRTLKREDTYDSSAKVYKFPAAEGRIGFSIWDGGNSGAKGTEDWAGTPTPWTSNTVYKMYVDSVTVKCTGTDIAPSDSSAGASSSASTDNPDNDNSDSSDSNNDNSNASGSSSDNDTSDTSATSIGASADNTSTGSKTDTGASSGSETDTETSTNTAAGNSSNGGSGSSSTGDSDGESSSTAISSPGKCHVVAVTQVVPV